MGCATASGFLRLYISPNAQKIATHQVTTTIKHFSTLKVSNLQNRTSSTTTLEFIKSKKHFCNFFINNAQTTYVKPKEFSLEALAYSNTVRISALCNKTAAFRRASLHSSVMTDLDKKANVVFVLGAPGSGKIQ